MYRSLVALCCCAAPALAELPSGSHDITLASATERITIGTVTFDGTGDTRHLKVVLTESLFKDHFLSMRPFKCLEGPKFYCHLPYPYEWKGVISEADLTDLEYALLFVQKAPTAYGINLWNGVYYRMVLESDGRITGQMHEVDMDTLASPPALGELRPLKPEALTAADPGGQWLPKLTIE